MAGGGSGWTSFDLGVLAEDSGEEVNPPNPQNAPANPMEAGLHEPDMNSVRHIIERRLVLHRVGPNPTVVDPAEVNSIVALKNEIFERAGHLDHSPLWTTHRNRLIRDFLQPPRGGEFSVSALQKKLTDLHGENPTSSPVFKQLQRIKRDFFLDAAFRAPRVN